MLGDATFFGKRDFVLCYCMVKLLQQHKSVSKPIYKHTVNYIIDRLPKLPFTQSIEFYSDNIKPIMASDQLHELILYH